MKLLWGLGICSLVWVGWSTVNGGWPSSFLGKQPATSPQPEIVQALERGQELPITATARLGKHIIQLEVAQTPQQQAMGLMYRKQLADNRGMLFPFQPPQPVKFWMQNTVIPLDMIFLYQGNVKSVIANVPPCQESPCPTYGPDNVVIDQVIELRGGRAKELGVSVGDRINVQYRSQ
jgi:uncharacterized membrane protein (UPF0127 family)